MTLMKGFPYRDFFKNSPILRKADCLVSFSRVSLSHDDRTIVIESYGYEFWHNSEKIAWHDSQPHPDDASLASTHPHHKHILPDIKHHRIPAPRLSFATPNLPVLIQEIEQLLSK